MTPAERALEQARAAIARRDPTAVPEVVMLLEQVDALDVTRTVFTGHGLGHGAYPADVPRRGAR